MKRSILLMAALLTVMLIGGCAQLKHSDTTEVKISPGSAPAAVTAAFQKDHPNAMITKVQKETYRDGTVHYEYTFIDSAGKEQKVEYSKTGQALPKH
jgi:outer membrane lipoprotein-sorting protein